MTETVPVLLYHAVAERTDPRFARWAVTPRTFAAHMALLAERGCQAITVRELLNEAVPPNAVVVTFDDGFADFHTHALPALLEHGLTATVYVPTAYVGRRAAWLSHVGESTRRLLSWDQLRAAASVGVEIGAHTHTHVQLDTVPDRVARAEVVASGLVLKSMLGRVDTFAYPHGAHVRRVREHVRTAGFSGACAVGNGLAALPGDPFRIGRVIVGEDTDLERVLDRRIGVVARRPVRRAAWRTVRRATGVR